MTSEVSILPDSFEQSNNSNMLIATLKDILNHGIFIVDFQTGNWSKLIQTTYINNYGTPAVRDKIIALIRQLKDRKKIIKLTNYNHTIENEDDWLEVTKLHNDNESLDLVVSGLVSYEQCKDKVSNKCCCINDVMADDKWEVLKQRDSVGYKTRTNFSKTLQGMFSHANVIKLIDPYLMPNGQSKQIIQLCIDHLKSKKNFDQGKGCIEIHTKTDVSISLDMNLARWSLIFESLDNPSSHSFKVYLWKDNSSLDKFHDRFILTNSMGVSVSHSFDLKDDSEQEITFNLLSQKTFEQHLNNFSEEDPKFQLESEREFNA